MKKILIITLLCICSAVVFSATEHNDATFQKRKQALENLEVFKSTITDTTKSVLKELVIDQNEIIAADNPIIEIYLDSLKSKADSLKRSASNLVNDKKTLDSENKSKSQLMFYGIVGAGVIFLGFILFFILFLISSKKVKNIKEQIEEVNKSKQAKQKEIDNAKKELETVITNSQQEITTVKEKANTELKNLQVKIDSLGSEKSMLEKKVNDKTIEVSQMQNRINDKTSELLQLQNLLNTTKNSYESKLADANANNESFRITKLSLENEISDKNQLIEKLQKENNKEKVIIEENPIDYRELYEKESRERKSIEGKLLDIENNNIKNPPIEISEYETIKRDNIRLKEDLEKLNEKIELVITTKNMIEEELRHFIDELRNIRN